LKKNVIVAIIAGVVIIAVVLGFQVYETIPQRTSAEDYYTQLDEDGHPTASTVVYSENPQFLKGLKINKDKYLLGEKVFIMVTGIPMGLKDSVQIFTPEGKRYLVLPFDGSEKNVVKKYFRPSLSLQLEICDKEQLIGEWTILFAGQPDERLKFTVVDEILPHSEIYYEGCGDAIELPMIDPSLGK